MTVKGIDQELEARDSIDRRMSQDVQEHIWAVADEDNREQPICKKSVYWPNKLLPAKERMVGLIHLDYSVLPWQE